jgi:superfamily II DNA or RNA helicase
VQVATIQTLLARSITPPADVIIADEAHHYVADDWRPFIDRYPGAIIIGPTATPARTDGKGLGAIFDRLIVGTTVRELTDAGFLCPAEIIRPPRKLRAGEIARRPCDAYHVHVPGRRAIVFSPSVAVAAEHAAGFQALGYRAAVVSGSTPWGERKQAFSDLRSGKLHALVNVYVATEGFDVPEIEAVILARGFGAAGTYIQCVGRALRLSPHTGKTTATVLDLTGTSYDHGHPDDERVYSLEGRGISRADDDPSTVQAYCRVCGACIEPGQACEECGTAPKAQAQRVANVELVRYASKRAEGVDQRAATLRRWYADCEARGWKPKAADVKFLKVYGAWPSAEIRAAARADVLVAA